MKKRKPSTRGVSWDKKSNCYRAYIYIGSKYIHLGTYHTVAEAKQARTNAEAEYEWSPGKLMYSTQNPNIRLANKFLLSPLVTTDI